MKNRHDVVCYLLSEGFNVSAAPWFRHIPCKNLKADDLVLWETILRRMDHPVSLKESCRTVIRKALRPKNVKKLHALDLPKSIKAWIVSDNIYSDKPIVRAAIRHTSISEWRAWKCMMAKILSNLSSRGVMDMNMF
ncbi:hypothetical protein DPMN_174172 [Dreissena polymorpha]|uniref:SOCS box domain-containing protein n=2 Tax=Dreissena polymorpha TaxID=45954 RepID=A0A9D4E5I6_DREPO|nr:hypothetical protein DPMN_174172 [Dreissena polymorpha]